MSLGLDLGVVQFYLNFLFNQIVQLNVLCLVIKDRLSSVLMARQFVNITLNQ